MNRYSLATEGRRESELPLTPETANPRAAAGPRETTTPSPLGNAELAASLGTPRLDYPGLLPLQSTHGNAAIARTAEARAPGTGLASEPAGDELIVTPETETAPATSPEGIRPQSEPAKPYQERHVSTGAQRAGSTEPAPSSEVLSPGPVTSEAVASSAAAPPTPAPPSTASEAEQTQEPGGGARRASTGRSQAGAPEAGAEPSGEAVAASGESLIEEGAAAAAPAEVSLDTTSALGMLESMSTVPPSSFGDAMSQASAAIPEIQSQEKAELEASFPEIERPTGLPSVGAVPDAEAPEVEEGSAPEAPAGGAREGEPPETEAADATGPVPGSQVSTVAVEPGGDEDDGSWWDWLVGRVRNFLASLPTSDPGLSTSAGDRPTVDLTGDANPALMADHRTSSDEEISANRAMADAATAADFGENDIYPTVPPEMLRPSYTPGAPGGGGLEAPGAAPALPAEARAMYDANMAPWLAAQVNEQVALQRTERARYEEESQRIRDEGDQQIADANEAARANQEDLRVQARTEVGDRRRVWLEENERVQQDYITKADAKRIEVDAQIETTVQTSETQSDVELTTAETRAENERIAAEARAADEKRKADDRPRSWWEEFRGAVSDAFDAVRSVVNGIFDALRQFVKDVIEAAKAVVRGIIEVARAAVVGLITAFGAAVKGFVSFALAAFPEARDAACEWIDQRVAGAVETVNEVADVLKNAADAILDWVGASLDSALGLWQAAWHLGFDLLEGAFNLMLDGMEILAKLWALITNIQPVMDRILQLIDDPTPAIEEIKTFIGGLVAAVPPQAESVAIAAITFSPPPKDHWAGIWRYLKPMLDDLAQNWWQIIVDTAWLMLWPFGKDSSGRRPLFEHVKGMGKAISDGWDAIWDFELGKAVDAALKIEQHWINIVGLFYGWIFIGLVIAGGILGAEAGVVPGMAAGAAIAGEIGLGLGIATLAVEAAILAKSGFDLVHGSNTPEEDEEDYKSIASSALTIAIVGVMFAIGAIASRIARAIISRIAGKVFKLPPKRGRRGTTSRGDVIELRVLSSERVLALIRGRTITWLEAIRRNFPVIDLLEGGNITVTPRPGRAPTYTVTGGRIISVKSTNQVGARALSDITGHIDQLAGFTTKGNVSVVNPSGRTLIVALEKQLDDAIASQLRAHATSQGVDLQLVGSLPPNHPAVVFPDQIPAIMIDAGIVAADEATETDEGD
jgi:hypothetical protein